MVENSMNGTAMSLYAAQYGTVNAISLSVRCSIVIYDRIDTWIVLIAAMIRDYYSGWSLRLLNLSRQPKSRGENNAWINSRRRIPGQAPQRGGD
jgi:hypothetical protein